MSQEQPQSVLYRPEGASKPRLHVNVRHKKIVKSFEFEAPDGLLYGALFVQQFDGDEFRRIGESQPTDYIGEVLNSDGDYLYCRKLGEGDAHVVRWDLSVAPTEMDEEVVLEFGPSAFDLPDADHVEIEALVDVHSDGRVLVVVRKEEQSDGLPSRLSYLLGLWDVDGADLQPLTPAREGSLGPR